MRLISDNNSRGFVYRTAGALCLCALFGLLLIIPSVSSETDNAVNTPLYSHWYGSGLDGSGDVLLEDLLEDEDASDSVADFNVGSFSLHRPQSELFINGLIGGLYDTAAAAAADGDAVENYLQARARAQLTDEAVPDFKTWLLGDGQGIGDRLLVGSADYVTDYLTAAATDSASGLRFVRTVEWDYQSALGERRWQTGLSALGALREGADDAIVWQLRGYAAEDSAAGANAGLIYRRVAGAAEAAGAADGALLGVNVFLDYEKHGDYDEDFLRWSLGGEYRNAYLDVYLNRYFPITDGIRQRNGNYIYTQGGQEAYLNVKAPDFAFGRVSGGLTYYLWEGEYGDADDKGFRYHIGFAPQQGNLKLELELDSPDSGSTDWGGRISYRHIIGAADKGTVAAAEDAAFDARAHFFDAVRREYAQRIRESGDGDGDGGTQAPAVMEFRVLEGSGTAGETAAQLNVLQLDPAADSEAATIVLQAPAAGDGAVQTITLSAQTVSITIAANSSLALSASRWQATVRAESTVRLVASGSRLEVVGGTVAFSRSGNGLNTIWLDGKTEHSQTEIALLGTQGEAGVNADSAAYKTFIRLTEGSVALTVNAPDAISVALVGLSATAVVDLTPRFLVNENAATVRLTLGCATTRQREEHRFMQLDYSGCEDDVYLEGLRLHALARLQTPEGTLTLRGVGGSRVSVVNSESDSYTLTATWARFPFHSQAATLQLFTDEVAISRDSSSTTATVSVGSGSGVVFTATVAVTANNDATVTATVVEMLVRSGEVADIGSGKDTVGCEDDAAAATANVLAASESGLINVVANCDGADTENPAAAAPLAVRAVGEADAEDNRPILDILVEGALTIKSRVNVGQTITLAVRGGGDISLEDDDTLLSLVSSTDGVAVLALAAVAAPRTENYILRIASANGAAAITREVVVEIIGGDFAFASGRSFHTATEVYGGGVAIHTVSVINALGRVEYTETDGEEAYNGSNPDLEDNFIVDKHSGVISMPAAVDRSEVNRLGFGGVALALSQAAGRTDNNYTVQIQDIYEYDRRLDSPVLMESYSRRISPPGAVATRRHTVIETTSGANAAGKNIGSFSSAETVDGTVYARAYEGATNTIYLHAVGNAGIASHGSSSVTLSGVSVDASGVIGNYRYNFVTVIGGNPSNFTFFPGFELVSLDGPDGGSVAIRMTNNCTTVAGGTGVGGGGCSLTEGSDYPPANGAASLRYDIIVEMGDQHPDNGDDLLVTANVVVYPSIYLVLSNDSGAAAVADGRSVTEVVAAALAETPSRIVEPSDLWVSSGDLERTVALTDTNTELARLARAPNRAKAGSIFIAIDSVNPPAARGHFTLSVASGRSLEAEGALLYNYKATTGFDRGGVVSVVLFAENRTSSGQSDLPGGRVAYTLEVNINAPLEGLADTAPTVFIDPTAIGEGFDQEPFHFGSDNYPTENFNLSSVPIPSNFFVNVGEPTLSFELLSVESDFKFTSSNVKLETRHFRLINIFMQGAPGDSGNTSSRTVSQPAGALYFSDDFFTDGGKSAAVSGTKATLMIKVTDGTSATATYALPLEMVTGGDINISFAGEAAPTVTITYKQTGALITLRAAVADGENYGGAIRYALGGGNFTAAELAEDPDSEKGNASSRLIGMFDSGTNSRTGAFIDIDRQTGRLSITAAIINEYARDDRNCDLESEDLTLDPMDRKPPAERVKRGCMTENAGVVDPVPIENLAGFALPRFSVTAVLVGGAATPAPATLPVVITVLPAITLEALPAAAIDKAVPAGTDFAGFALYTVRATTATSTAPDITFRYTIIGGNASAAVSLHRDSGILSIADGINRANTVTLTIAARDVQVSINALTTTITVGWKWRANIASAMYIIGGRASSTDNEGFSEVWSSVDGEIWERVSNAFPSRHSHGAAILNGTIFISGGISLRPTVNSSGETLTVATALNDAWASADGGVSWSQTATNIGGARARHTMVNEDGRLYLIEGVVNTDPNARSRDSVYYSDDGVNWIQIGTAGLPGPDISNEPNSPSNAAVVQHRGSVFIIGGTAGRANRTADPNTVYIGNLTLDLNRGFDVLVTNFKVLTAAALSRFTGGRAVSYNDRIYLTGGRIVAGTGDTSSGVSYTEVWSSADGASWVLENADAPFGNLRDHVAYVKGVSMFVAAGSDDGTFVNDVWASSDGRNWNRVTAEPGFSNRSLAAAVVFTPADAASSSDTAAAAPAAVEAAPSPQPQEDAPPLAINSAFPIIRDDGPAVAFLDEARRRGIAP